MAKRLTVHLKDSVTETYVEVDGERIKSDAVRYTGAPGTWGNVEIYITDAEVIDERSGVKE